jgi:acetyl-CoA C-acetyltransferase
MPPITVDPRTPVLVGVGTAADPCEPAELMARAVEAAAHDAGSTTLVAAADRIAVPQGTWSYADPARLVAARVGATGARTHLAQIGVSQQTVVSQMLRAIADGRSDVAVVVGGEARAWARTDGANETAQPGAVPDEVETREPEFFAAPELAAGMVIPPVQQYALIENALAHDAQQAPAAHRQAIADLWARFNQVAAGNPAAAFAAPKTANDLLAPSPGNRPLAFPYNKWHASQWTVDQAAALVVCSAEAARRHGVPADRWIFPLVGVDANHSVSLSRRRFLHRWPAMQVLGQAAAARLGRPLADADIIEVYSCFPSAVRVQQRELDLPVDGTPTVTGGMAFAGGPFNNFVYQATAAVVPHLRERPGAVGVVTTVCGLLTKPGLAVWSAEPDGRPPLLDDLAGPAVDATPTVNVLDEHHGRATVASFTVTYDGLDPVRVAVVADVDQGAAAGHDDPVRCVAAADDPELAAHAVDAGLIDTRVDVDGLVFRL